MSNLDLLPRYTYNDYSLWEGDWELIEGVSIPQTISKNGDTYHIDTYNSTHIGWDNSGTVSSGDGNSMAKV
jgi:hypothetical protein